MTLDYNSALAISSINKETLDAAKEILGKLEKLVKKDK